MKQARLTFAVLAMAALLAAPLFSPVFCAEAKKDKGLVALTPEEAGPDYAVQGEYLATLGENKGGMQVIALGKEGFRAVFYNGGLPGAGFDGKEKQEVNGKWEGDVVKFTRPDKATFSMTITKAGEASGINERGQRIIITKVQRQSPTLGAKPPQGAVVLFDGKDASNFEGGKVDARGLLNVGVRSRQKFKDHSLHIEFLLPFMPDARGQGRANSGVYVQNRYEVQVLDSFGLKGEDNECGGLYRTAKPLVNMCLPPLVWQTYDIDFTAARFDESGKKTKNARLTVKHNGVLIHDDFELPASSGGGEKETAQPGALSMQDHGNPVFFRNIWVVEKK